MFKTAIKSLAAAVVAVGCVTVSAEAGSHKSGHAGHGVHAHGGKTAHGGGAKMVRGHAGGHGTHYSYHHGYRHGGGLAVGIASGLAIGHAGYGTAYSGYSYPAGKGCGATTYYRPVAVTTVTTSVAIIPRAPACVCD
jgi:hypothetical protein